LSLKCPSHYHIYRSVTCNVIQLIIVACEVGHRGDVIMITAIKMRFQVVLLQERSNCRWRFNPEM
jgi:hypothetical protein